MTAMTVRTLVRLLPPSSLLTLSAVLVGASLSMTSPAAAVSANVRNACMGDYFNFCAGMEVDSPELRRCFNRNGKKLSSGCVSALVAAGEVSQAEVNRRAAKSKVASAAKSRTASRAQCVQGPARPGAKASSTCRSVAASRGGKAKRQLVTLR